MTRCVCGAAVVLLAASGVAVRAVDDESGSPPRPRPARPVAVPTGPPKLDRNGDPLPPGAVARYGSARLRHGLQPLGLSFSPDGKTLGSAAGTHDGLRLWDAATGKETARLDIPVTAVAFVPDGTLLAVSGARCKHWTPGKGVRDLPEKTLPENVRCLAVDPAGRSFAAGITRKVLLIDLQTGKNLRELACPGNTVPTRLAFSPDGRWLAGSGQAPGVWLWDLRTGRRIRTYQAVSDHPEYAFSPDGNRIAVTGERLVVYPVDSEEPVGCFTPPEGQLYGPRFSADGKWVYGLSDDGALLRVDAATGEVKESLRPPLGISASPGALSPDVSLAAGVDQRGGIRIWNPQTGEGPEAERLPALSRPGFSADGKTVWVLAVGGLHSFDAATGKPGKTVSFPEQRDTPTFWEPAARRVTKHTVANDVVTAVILDADTGKELCQIPIDQNADYSLSLVAYCPTDPKRVAVFQPGSVVLASGTTGKTIRVLKFGKPEASPQSQGAFSPDGRLLAVASQKLSVWEIATGKRRLEFDTLPEIEGTAFSPDGRRLAGWDPEGNISVFDVRLGTVRQRFRSSPLGVNFSLAFSPDGNRIALGEADGNISVRDVGTGEELIAFAASDNLQGLAWSPDGTRLASASSGGTVLVWEVPAKGVAPNTGVAGFEDAFRRLGLADPAEAQPGMEYLYRRATETPKECANRIAVPAGTAANRVVKLVAELGDEDFQTREEAAKALEEIGVEAVAALRKAAEGSPSPEVRTRAGEALSRIENRPATADELRAVRAVEILEQLGTAEAKAVLSKWAAGPAGLRLVSDATAALARLNARGR